MSIAKILVPAIGTHRDEAAIFAAIRVAQLCRAHVVVQFVHPDPASAIPMLGVPLSGDVMQAIIDGQTKFAQAAAARTRKTMTNICHGEAVKIVDCPKRSDIATCSFRLLWGDADHLTAEAAKLSDLIVFGPIDWRDSPEINESFLTVLRSVRRPVLVANGAASGPLRTITLGWDGSTFAANAIRAALPILQLAEHTVVVVVDSERAPSIATQELRQYLTRNGVNYVPRMLKSSRTPPVDALMSEAVGSDLLVAGGYGHDHLWETFFGGATARLLADAKLPVLFAH